MVKCLNTATGASTNPKNFDFEKNLNLIQIENVEHLNSNCALKLRIKIEDWNWKLKFEIKIWNRNWKLKLEIKIENWNWKSILGVELKSWNWS